MKRHARKMNDKGKLLRYSGNNKSKSGVSFLQRIFVDEKMRPDGAYSQKGQKEREMVEKALELYRKYREMILYLIFGGLTTLVNIFSYFVLTDVGKIQYLVSTAIAWVLSVLFAYFTNRVWVFRSTASGAKAIAREMGSFFGCRLLSGVIDMGIMFVCVSVLGLPDKVIKILANVVVIILNYLFSKLFIFKKDHPARQ